MQRSLSERIFLVLFLPSVVIFYTLYKYPQWINGSSEQLQFLGKNLGFWYSLVYTAIVCGICGWVLLRDKNPYWRAKVKKPINSYQRNKFISIFFVQLFVFFLAPYLIAPLISGSSLLHDAAKLPFKDAHVYFFPAFKSWGMALYLLVIIPVIVYFFGKRYCSWFCSCGNLAEAVGVTEWGTKWVQEGTPRGETSKKMELLQTALLIYSLAFGAVILFDSAKLFGGMFSPVNDSLQAFQNLMVDFLFGSVLGVGLYPFLGTRVWCRFGCPLAKWMQFTGSWFKSRFSIQINDKCKGLNLCTSVCPMGIDVASYAHKDKKPLEGEFGLAKEPCIGCGGCISICPVEAISFSKVS
jgi:polyferredoxin